METPLTATRRKPGALGWEYGTSGVGRGSVVLAASFAFDAASAPSRAGSRPSFPLRSASVIGVPNGPMRKRTGRFREWDLRPDSTA